MLWWSDELKIGIKKVDAQHKGIFDRAGHILSLQANSKPSEVREVFEFLLKYVVTHFKDEEEVMEKAEYPELESHKKQHAYITYELSKIVDKVIRYGIKEESIDELKLLIIEWLINHISESDRKIADFINSKI